MSQDQIDAKYLINKAQIESVICQYFQGLDHCNQTQVRNCFDSHIRAAYHGREVVQGIDALMSSLKGVYFDKIEAGELRLATHFKGNFNVGLLEEDAAETETNALAFLVKAGSPVDRVAMRSLRYLDRWRRGPGGWRITERIHTLDWSCEENTTFARSMAKRILQLPHEAQRA